MSGHFRPPSPLMFGSSVPVSCRSCEQCAALRACAVAACAGSGPQGGGVCGCWAGPRAQTAQVRWGAPHGLAAESSWRLECMCISHESEVWLLVVSCMLQY